MDSLKMVAGTTEILNIYFNFGLELIDKITFSFVGKDGGHIYLQKSKGDCELLDGKITIKLTQEDTLKLKSDVYLTAKILFEGRADWLDVKVSDNLTLIRVAQYPDKEVLTRD